MKKKWFAGIVVFLIMALLFGVPLVSHSQTPQVIRFSHGFPVSHFMVDQVAAWAKAVEQRSKGALKIELYPMAQLYRDNELCRAVQMGAIEGGLTFDYTIETALSPTIKVVTLPFVFRNTNDFVKVAQSDVRTKLSEVPEKKGVKMLAWMTWPGAGMGLALKKPARVPADVKGLVMRSPSPTYTALFKKWGVGGSYIPGTETYMALQQGTIQGSGLWMITVLERKLYEVAPHFTLLPVAGMYSVPILGKAFFEKLSPELQKIIMEESRAMEAKSGEAAERAQSRVLEFARSTGKIVPYTPTKAEMDLWGKHKEEVWKEVLKGDKEMLGLVARIREIIGEK